MAEMDCESLLLDEVPGKYSEEFDDIICNADEEALLADIDETDIPTNPPGSGSRNKFAPNSKQVEQDSDDVLELGSRDAELDEEYGGKGHVSLMTVSSTTPADQDLNPSMEEHEERETRFKQERKVTTSTKKYANIPDSLDDVVITNNYSHNNSNHNQRSFRGRGREIQYNNTQRRHPNKTVLINPHFKGKVNVISDTRFQWDAREHLNYKNQLHQGNSQPLIQNSTNGPNPTWNNPQNLQIQQPTAPQFQQFVQPQQISQQMYHQPPMPPQHTSQVPNNWNQIQGNVYPQVPQQLLHAYQPPESRFIPPRQQDYYTQPPQFTHPSQFNHSVPQFQQPLPQFSSEHTQYAQSNPIRVVTYPNHQYIVPQNQPILSIDPYGQPVFNQNFEPLHMQVSCNQQNKYSATSSPTKIYPMTNLVMKTNNGGIRKNKKRNQVVNKNLHEVRTVQIPDTTVQEDDEDEETKAYRKLIENQKKKREQILEQKEARRRQALQLVHNNSTLRQIQTVVPAQQRNPIMMSKPVKVTNRIISKPLVDRKAIQQLLPVKPITNITQNVHTVTTTIINPINPHVKVLNMNNEVNVDKQHLTSFLTNRKILAKDQSLLDTNIVLISNLANGTTALKLRKMCIGIGDVKNLQMSPKERQATIEFNSVASAHAFFKKFQRTMLDLSMIQVTLKPLT